MKTIQIVCLSLMTGFVLLTSCKKDEQDLAPSGNQQNADFKSAKPGPPVEVYGNWKEDFTTANSLALRWNLYGTHQPQWVNFAFNRFGLFDNNGRLPNGSFAVSKTKIGNGNGYIIESEVYIDVTNPGGTTICPAIGVTRYPDLPSESSTVEAGISMKLLYLGKGVPDTLAVHRNHTYIQMSALLQDGTSLTSADPKNGIISSSRDYAFQADVAGNGWHKMKIVVTSSKQVGFFLDDKFIWSPNKPVHPSLMTNKNVLIGFTSSGNAGKAYHDYVKVTYPPLPDQPTELINSAATE